MKTKLATLLALAAGLIANSVSAQDYTLTLDMTAGTKYVFRGVQLGDDTLHPSIEFGMDDFYAGIWGAQPVENRSSKGFGDEFDFYAGQSFAINESTSVDAGATLFYYPTAENTLEGYVGISHEMDGGASVSAYAYRDVDLDTWTFEGSGGYSFPLADNSSLDFAVYVGTILADDSTDYTYYGADAVVPIELKENATLSFGLHWADHDFNGLPDNHFYGTGSITIGF